MGLHNHGGTWIFYAIVPVIFFGVAAALWLIVRGAIGLFGQTGQEGHDRRCVGPPSTTGGTQQHGLHHT